MDLTRLISKINSPSPVCNTSSCPPVLFNYQYSDSTMEALLFSFWEIRGGGVASIKAERVTRVRDGSSKLNDLSEVSKALIGCTAWLSVARLWSLVTRHRGVTKGKTLRNLLKSQLKGPDRVHGLVWLGLWFPSQFSSLGLVELVCDLTCHF